MHAWRATLHSTPRHSAIYKERETSLSLCRPEKNQQCYFIYKIPIDHRHFYRPQTKIPEVKVHRFSRRVTNSRQACTLARVGRLPGTYLYCLHTLPQVLPLIFYSQSYFSDKSSIFPVFHHGRSSHGRLIVNSQRNISLVTYCRPKYEA